MSELFIISDTHFRHHNILKFEPEHFGQFQDIDERDEWVIHKWNAKVQPNDTVWHLGDIAFNIGLPILKRLNGKFELLLMGNHEHKNIKEYLPYFKDIKSVKDLGDLIFSHYPMHPSQLEERYKANIHGHVHSAQLDDPRYLCVSMECVNCEPISMSEIKQELRKRKVL